MIEKLRQIVSGRFTLLKMLVLGIRFVFTKPDKRMGKYKNKYLGKRCFIIGLGPSLRISDLEKLEEKKEICFSVNKIYELFQYTKWRPDFYFISDYRAVTEETGRNIDDMTENHRTSVFYTKNAAIDMNKKAIRCRVFDIYNPLHNTRSLFLKERARHVCLAKDAGKYIYDGVTCITSAIQLAYYMGFKQVYLLGCDCGASKGQQYAEGLRDHGDCIYGNQIEKILFDSYISLKKDIEKKGIDFKIYNATRGGLLDVFERVDFDEFMDNAL